MKKTIMEVAREEVRPANGKLQLVIIRQIFT